jgi:hypothetical protein
MKLLAGISINPSEFIRAAMINDLYKDYAKGES